MIDIRTRLALFGLIAGLLLSLAACSPPGETPRDEDPRPVTITWLTGILDSEFEFTESLAAAYMAANPHEIAGVEYEVTIDVERSSDTDRYGQYRDLLEAESQAADLLEIDVVWTGDLAEHLLDLSAYDAVNAVIPAHFAAIVDNNTAEGRLVGLPLFADAALLYYRTDLLSTYGYAGPPLTWDQLESMAFTMQEGQRAGGNSDFWGYVWQGDDYEGLAANALEWVHSHGGGSVVEPAGVVSIDNPNAVAAIARAAQWLNGAEQISPAEVVTFREESARSVWQAGNAAFMRNWPYAYALTKNGPLADDFAITKLPDGGGGPASTLGGWQLAVNRYAEHADVAVDVALYAAAYENQLDRALSSGHLPTIPAVYDDPELLASDFAWLADVKPVLEDAVARPSTATAPHYNEVSQAFYEAVHEVLSGTSSPEDALSALSSELATLLGLPTGSP